MESDQHQFIESTVRPTKIHLSFLLSPCIYIKYMIRDKIFPCIKNLTFINELRHNNRKIYEVTIIQNYI